MRKGPETKRPDWVTHFDTFGMKKTPIENENTNPQIGGPQLAPNDFFVDLALNVVNTEKMLKELNFKSLSNEQFKKELKDILSMQEVEPSPLKNFIKAIATSQREDTNDKQVTSLIQMSDELKDKIIEAYKEVSEELHEKFDKEQSFDDVKFDNMEPITLDLDDIESFRKDIMRLFPDPKSISKGPDKNVKPTDKQREIAEKLRDFLRSLREMEPKVGPNISGENDNTEFQITRLTDGTYNIIANSALYTGMLLRPTENFQYMKDTAEQVKMPFNITLFAKNDELIKVINDAQPASTHTATHFNPSPFSTKNIPNGK